MRILLVRHGESHANVDRNINKIIPDHEIALSSRGKEQAFEAGTLIKTYYEREFGDRLKLPALEEATEPESIADLTASLANAVKFMSGATRPQIRLWHSPYRRTRETADIISGVLGNYLLDKREHVLLCEQQFGLFDGVNNTDREKFFPAEFTCFERTKKANGKFWARYPMGESAFDTACRIHQAFGTFQRDAEDYGIDNIIVVCHGTVLRLFTMMWRHLSPEWFAKEENPGNCAIRILDNKTDHGYLFNGWSA
jgi:2,3-bisphosphoglycerate-dependent phosphoglycerate mutase